MVICYDEAQAALKSMRKFLDEIKEKLSNEDVIGDIDNNERLKRKKALVEEKIGEWENIINSD